MASKLFGIARTVSEYVRMRAQRQYRNADEAISQTQTSSYVKSRRALTKRLVDLLFGEKSDGINPTDTQQPHAPGQAQSPPQSPPVDLTKIWPGAPGAPPYGDEDDFVRPEDIQLLGRDAGYDPADFQAVMDGMRLTPGSSNVYGYYFEREARRTGTLYVTFLGTLPGGKRAGAGPTYAYYDVSVRKALEFQRAAAASAGNAVWDYLRIRGTVSGHQHNYRLVHVTGEYVPRKATPIGFRDRAVPALGVGRRSFRRNTLPAVRFAAAPNRGGPNRGGPNRGTPPSTGP